MNWAAHYARAWNALQIMRFGWARTGAPGIENGEWGIENGAHGVTTQPALGQKAGMTMSVGAVGAQAVARPHGAGRDPGLGQRFFGAIIITICRPSRRGRDSMTMSSPRSASIRAAISRPSS